MPVQRNYMPSLATGFRAVMLDKAQLTQLFDRLGTPPAGRQLVLEARLNAPVRDVASKGGNVITVLGSRKMGREIATESRHIEFVAAVGMEYDDRVLEYYPQPCKRTFEFVDARTGEIHTHQHTPDFLTIKHDGFTLEEWKSEVKLQRLAEQYPYRYVKESDGLWCSPTIEEQLAELGIRYRICSDAAISRWRLENVLYLEDYFHSAAEPCPEAVLAALNEALREHGHLTFAELLKEPYQFKADCLNKAIADNLVVTDLDRETLTEKRLFHLYRDEVLRDFKLHAQATARRLPALERFALDISTGTKFVFDGQELTISVAGEDRILCNLPDGSSTTVPRAWLLSAHEKNQITVVQDGQQPTENWTDYEEEELVIALRRQAMLELPPSEKVVSSRTLRRWAARQRVVAANGGNEILALVRGKGGNHTVRISELQMALMDRVIDEKWRTSEAINYMACYRFLEVACKEAGVDLVSYPTLIQHIKAKETNRDVRVRYGKRIAYQQDTFVPVLHYDTVVHGCRPFQYVHIDHTELDIEAISSRTGKPLGRPWLTLAIDAWSRRILAFYLTFDSPSYDSAMMIIRDLVRRFHRLPQFIVVDNGTDFLSNAFRAFLRSMGTKLRFRPAGQPRHGSVLERLFGRLHTEYIHSLAGNTKATKNVRTVTGSHLPKKLAEWTLQNLYYGIQFWATEYYDQECHPALGESPREAFQRGLRESGQREHKHVLLNRDFLIATCPPVDRTGTRQVNRQRGVKVGERLYWSDVFRAADVAGKSFPVRYDPWDASSVYVWVKGQWHQAICRSLRGLRQLTEVEQLALSGEFHRRTKTRATDPLAAQRLREFTEIFTPKGAMAVEFERQAENKSLYNSLQLASVTPVELPRRSSLIEETSSAADVPAEQRSTKTTNPSTPLQEATGVDDSLDFDEF